MNVKRLGAAFSSAVLGFSSLLTLSTAGIAAAAANTCTWTGTTDLKFSTTTNWSGCGGVAPVNGDNLVFNNTALTASKVLNNDLTNLTTGTVTFTGTSSNFYNFTVTGNALTLGGNVTDSSTGNDVIDVDAKLAADTTVTYTGTYNSVQFGASTDVTPHTLDTQGHQLTVTGTGAQCGVSIMSKLVGSGNLTASLATGLVNLMADSATYSGGVTVASGKFSLGANATLGNTTGVTVSGGTLGLVLSGDKTFGFPISLNGTGASQYYGTITADSGIDGCGGGSGPATATATLSGAVTLNSDIVYSGNYNTKVTGTYNANGHKVTSMAGSLGTFTAAGSTTQVTLSKRAIADTDSQPALQEYANSGEELSLDGVRGDTEVFSGGVLKGSGKVAKLTIDGGAIVAPGHSPGCLTASSGLNMYGTFQAEIGGTTPCTGYDQIKVTGAVDLGGGANPQGILAASLYNNFKPAAGQSYTIIDNDAADAVNGTFKGLAEGATFTVNGYVMQISYKGGDGNDVVLTVKNVPATPDTGFALVSANPLMTLVMTTMAAAGILVIAQKTRAPKTAARRRR